MPCIVIGVLCDFYWFFNFQRNFELPSGFQEKQRLKKKQKKKKEEEEERKKKSLVYSPTKSFTFSVGATESELVICMEPAAVIFRF